MVKCPALNSTPKPTTATTHQELSGRKVGRHHGAVAVTVAAASVPSSQAACITRAPAGGAHGPGRFALRPGDDPDDAEVHRPEDQELRVAGRVG